MVDCVCVIIVIVLNVCYLGIFFNFDVNSNVFMYLDEFFLVCYCYVFNRNVYIVNVCDFCFF